MVVWCCDFLCFFLVPVVFVFFVVFMFFVVVVFFCVFFCVFLSSLWFCVFVLCVVSTRFATSGNVRRSQASRQPTIPKKHGILVVDLRPKPPTHRQRRKRCATLFWMVSSGNPPNSRIGAIAPQ